MSMQVTTTARRNGPLLWHYMPARCRSSFFFGVFLRSHEQILTRSASVICSLCPYAALTPCLDNGSNPGGACGAAALRCGHAAECGTASLTAQHCSCAAQCLVIHAVFLGAWGMAGGHLHRKDTSLAY